MCPRGRPRGQGRSRGLHLCYTIQFFQLAFKCQISSAFKWL